MCSIDINELLLRAVEEKNEEKICRYIQSGADVNYRDPISDLTPLFIIAINTRSRLTAMNEAEAQLQARIATLLIEAGADLESLISFEADYLVGYLTVLQIAVYFHNDAVIDVLLNYGADVNATSPYNGFTALHYAVDDVFCDTNIVKRLLQVSDVQMNRGCRRNGNTPLHLAITKEKNSEELIELLLKYGADAKKKNRRGMNPMQEYLDNVISLRTSNNCRFRGIEPSLLKLIPPSEIDTSSLHLACIFHRTSEVCKLALGMTDGEINARDSFGHTPLFYAVMARGEPSAMDKNSTARLLLNLGADINQQYGRYNHPDDVDHEEGTYSILDIAILLGDRQVSVIILQHLAKLVVLQSGNEEEKNTLDDFNLDLIHWRDEKRKMSELWQYCADCHEELRTMKESKVLMGASPISFFDLLTADPKKSAVYAKRKKLVEAFEVGMCGDVFPIYRGTIFCTNFGRAVEHRKLAEHAAELLSDFLRFADSRDVFFEKTLSYFDNDDLKLLLDTLHEVLKMYCCR